MDLDGSRMIGVESLGSFLKHALPSQLSKFGQALILELE